MRYARPIRWLVALYENRVIPFEIAHVKTGRTTYGHRFLGGEITLELPREYGTKLKENFVIADSEMRRQLILDEMEKLAGEKSFHIPADSGLLNEVTNLVEFPTVFAGTYDSAFLDLPAEVLVTSMKEHQRYFPVQSEAGNLLSYFIGVRNGDSYKLDTVIKGNEKVLHARLSDARFFYEEDRKQSIAFFQEKLERVVFQEKLGTIHDKVNRIIRITKEIGRLLNVNEVTLSKAERAAEICKFDLPTNMVNEFTELQGIMGERYALYFGEDEAVAVAIREHYMPVNANGELPVTEAGSIVSAADKLDTIVGCISAGLIPTGSHDPYGLRRQATGILRIMDRKGWHIRLEDLIAITQAVYQPLDLTADSGKTADDLHQFFQLRAAYLLKEEGIEQDVIQAVLKEEIGFYSYSLAKAAVLSEMRSDPGFKNVQEALVRVLNLAKKAEQTEVNQDLLATDSEKTLYQQFVITSENAKLANDKQEARQALQQLGELTEPINNFFEHNMVMAEDAALRKNRLALVNNIAALLYDFADLSEIQWKQHS
jgi:glycyl-tRNA synthetase beta chain